MTTETFDPTKPGSNYLEWINKQHGEDTCQCYLCKYWYEANK